MITLKHLTLKNQKPWDSPPSFKRPAKLILCLVVAWIGSFGLVAMAQETDAANTDAQNSAPPASRATSSSEVINISSTVTGNQEQPNEIYIVPWKSAVDRTILYQTLNTRLENVFGHIERREHIRQLELIEGLSKTEQEN